VKAQVIPEPTSSAKSMFCGRGSKWFPRSERSEWFRVSIYGASPAPAIAISFFAEHFPVVVCGEPVVKVEQMFRAVTVPDAFTAVRAFQEQEFPDRRWWV
jgi:hypothetical protein